MAKSITAGFAIVDTGCAVDVVVEPVVDVDVLFWSNTINVLVVVALALFVDGVDCC